MLTKQVFYTQDHSQLTGMFRNKQIDHINADIRQHFHIKVYSNIFICVEKHKICAIFSYCGKNFNHTFKQFHNQIDVQIIRLNIY